MVAAWFYAVLCFLCIAFGEPFGSVTFAGLAIGTFLSSYPRARAC